MKQQAAQKRTTQTQTRRRTAATNTHERQAREAAARILSGEQNVNRLLTYAPAAPRVHVNDCFPHMRAERLPEAVLTLLESGFDANLDVVRVYRDDAAAQLAAKQRARAFTSGRDIYFADGQYRPHSAEGVRLIAHETAHVLQQTGRMDADGVMIATPTYGSGEPQHADPEVFSYPFVAFAKIYRSFAVVEDDSQETKDALEKVLSAIGAAMNTDGNTLIEEASGKGTAFKALADEVAATTKGLNSKERREKAQQWWDLPAFARSALLDLMKLSHNFQAAAVLLKRDSTLKTVSSYPPFMTYLQKSLGKNWFVEYFDQIEPINNVFPDAATITVWDYLVRPTRKPTYVKAFHDLATKYLNNYPNPPADGILRDNERIYGAYLELKGASVSIFKLLNQYETQLSNTQPTMRRRVVAQILIDRMEKAKSSELLLEQKLAEPIQAAAKRALEYWTRAEELLKLITGEAKQIVMPEKQQPAGDKAPAPTTTPAPPPTPAPLPEVPAKVWSHTLYKAFVADVNSGLTGVLGSASGMPTLLNAKDYQAALRTLRDAVVKHRYTFSDHLSKVIVWDTSGNPDRFNEAVWFAVAQLVIDRIVMVLDLYDAAREEVFDQRYGGLPDVRLSHRFDMAREAARLAKFTRDSKLLAAAETVMAGTDLGYSYMAFTGDWKRDDPNINKMKKDFSPPTLPIGGLGISVEQLVDIYKLLRSNALIDNLTELLETYKDDFSLESYGLIAKAQKVAREEVPYPGRWIAERAFVVWNDQDKDTAGKRNLNELILAHPRYLELERKGENSDRMPLINATRADAPVVWMLPDLETIRTYLYSMPTLAKLLESKVGQTPTLDTLLSALNELAMEARAAHAKRLERARAAGKELKDIPLTPIEEVLEKLFLAISAPTKTELKQAQPVKTGLYIQATIHDRKVIEKAASALLDKYADENDRIGNYSLPTRAIDLIDDFARHIMPQTTAHIEAQMALLILSLADNLENAFIEDDALITQILGTSITEDRYDIITGLWGHINTTIDFAEGKSVVKKEGDTPLTRQAVAELLRSYTAKDESPEMLLLFGTKNLKILRDAFQEKIIESQMKGGIIGSVNPHELQRVDGKGSVAVGPEAEPLRYEGISYIVTKIERDFTFHPAYGMRGTGSYVPSILKDADGNDIPRRKDIVLLRYIIESSEELTITASLDDEEALRELATAAVMTDLLRGLLATADLIETVFKTGRDIASLFIPGGPAIVLLMDMAEFMIEDMPVIREDIIDAPMKAVRALEAFISPEMRDKMIEKLWIYLLFEGDLPFAEALMGLSKKKESRTSSRRKGKFAKMAAFAKNVGLRLLEAFFALQMRVRSGMIRASRVVQRKALLRQLVRILPRIIDYGSTIKNLDQAKELLGELIEGDVPAKVSAAFREALDELFGGLNGLEVPDQILPLDLVVEIVIERLIRAMGAKGKIVQKLMEISTFQQKAAEKVAEVLRDNGLDPNILWQETIQDELQGLLNEARDGLLSGVNSLLKTYLGDFFVIPDTGLETIEIAKDKEIPTLEPLLIPGARTDEEDEEDSERRSPPRIDPHLGQPLPPARREHYESLFGHDFAHVRLHSGRDAARLTSYYQAEALTSGSHIFLSEDAPPASGRAERVLRHEMAHVLQQTGARPRDHQQDPKPTLGERGRGLQVDPRREHAAEQMARAAVTRGDDAVPVQEEDLLGGLMPMFSDEIKRRVIDYLGGDKLANTFVEQIDSLKAVPSKISVEQRGQFEAAVTAAEAIWNDVDKLLRTNPTGGAGKNPVPFNQKPAIEGVETYFGGKPVPMPRNPIIRALTFYSFHEKRGKLLLDYGRYKVNLENYLYAKTGVDIKIDYRAAAAGKAPDVQFIRVNYVDLGDVSAHSKIYTNMKLATDKHMAAHIATLGAPFTAIEWGKIREVLRGGAAEREVWDHHEYRLSDGFINEMREFVNATGAGNVDTWANYVKYDDVANPNYGGLRVGTHGQLRGMPTGNPDLEPAAGTPGSGSMTSVSWAGRQSHHLPQFLLVEYFEDDNKKTVSRSVKGKETFPPGFQTAGTRATGFNDSAGHTLDFQKLDSNSERGVGLPAVSLAAKTHQKGQLHIVSATTWGDYRKPFDTIEITGSGTQGERINRIFYDLLKKELSGFKGIGPTTDDGVALEKAHQDAKGNAPKVLKAIQRTYIWMYKGMKQALERTLTKNVDDEQHYEAISYRSFAMSRPDTTDLDAEGKPVLRAAYRPTNIGLSDVVNAIEGKNKIIMKDWWTT